MRKSLQFWLIAMTAIVAGFAHEQTGKTPRQIVRESSLRAILESKQVYI